MQSSHVQLSGEQQPMTVGSDISDIESAQSIAQPHRCRPAVGRLAAGALVGLAVVGTAVVGFRAHRSQVLNHGNTRGSVKLFIAEAAEMLGAVWEGYKSSKEVFDKNDELLETLSKSGEIEGDKEETEKLKEEKLEDETGKHLLRKESMDDGNVCADDEEYFGGLCYRKCEYLHPGYPIRTSAFSCCEETPCGVFNSKTSSLLKWCGDNSVSGELAGHSMGKCPHPPGVCYQDEELHMGMCYMKCNLLTNGTYLYRSGASTCCKRKNVLACADVLYSQTKPEYAVGGGNGDHNNATFAYPHPPISVEKADIRATYSNEEVDKFNAEHSAKDEKHSTEDSKEHGEHAEKTEKAEAETATAGSKGAEEPKETKEVHH